MTLFKFSVIVTLLCGFILDCFAWNLTRIVSPSPSRRSSEMKHLTPSISVNTNSKSLNHLVSGNINQETTLPIETVYYSHLATITSSFLTQTSSFSTWKTLKSKAKTSTSISAFSLGDCKNGNCSSVITAIVSELVLNLTKTKSLANRTKTNSNCNTKNGCYRYGARWLNFYIKIGGWIMLAVVLLGIAALIITHILGRRHAISNDFTTARNKDVRFKGSWI